MTRREAERFTLEEVIQVLRNMGVDVACGACMEVVFTGVTLAEHSCALIARARVRSRDRRVGSLGEKTP